MSEAQLDWRLSTSCCLCGEQLGHVEICDLYVYDFDGTLDYIQLSHATCVSALPMDEWSNWNWENDK